ncbi:MAG: M20/M25/M40 family metallo-hydrolase [Spirochaetales bacterium]|nr:MAG: M20/M25/M40 family metallo-hydrolase [Spirochaetales bacterium]
MESSLEGDKELILGNLILLGEVPSYAGTWQSDDETASTDYSVRARFFAERLVELGVDECTTDPLGNPIGLIKGSDPGRAPILVVAELDSMYAPPGDIHYSIKDGLISGPGIMDNAVGAAAALSLPDVLRRHGIATKAPIMIAGIANTMRDAKNLTLFERFIDHLEINPCAVIIVKGGELGRLNYFSNAVVRADIVCERRQDEKGATEDMVVVATAIVDHLLAIRVPTRPQTALTVGMIKAGYKYGDPAAQARIGLELRSVSNEVLADISSKILGIIDLVRYEMRVDVTYDVAVELGAANLGWEHPLTRQAVAVMRALDLEPDVYPSVSELYYFLKRGIPAITIGAALGSDYHQETANAHVDSLYRGMAQLVGIVMAIDEEVCHD